jgi:SAM-dependent methyltransferase
VDRAKASVTASAERALLRKRRNYVDYRDLERYLRFFTLDRYQYPTYSRHAPRGDFKLRAALEALPEGSVYLNVGSGEGIAEQDLLKAPWFRGKIVGVDVAPATPRMSEAQASSSGRLAFLNNKTLEQRATQLRQMYPEGVDLITDLFSSDSYSRALDKNLEIKLSLLKPGGVLATVIPTTSFPIKFSSMRVATRIVPTSAKAKKQTRLARRIREYLGMEGLPPMPLKNLRAFQAGPFPDWREVPLDLSTVSDAEVPVSFQQDGAIKRMTSELGGVLGWLDGIRGVEIIGLATPNEEQGVTVVLRRTKTKLKVPALSLIDYQLGIGPARRFYTW